MKIVFEQQWMRRLGGRNGRRFRGGRGATRDPRFSLGEPGARPFEEPAHSWLESLERHGVVVGVERGLVPLLAEIGRALEHRMSAIKVARVPVLTVMVPEEVSLEDRVVLHQPVIVLGDVRPQDGSGELCVVVRRQRVADIVQQGDHHGFVVGAVALGARRALQRVLEPVDLVAKRIAAELVQKAENLVCQTDLVLLPVLVEKLVVLVRALIHADETDRAVVHSVPRRAEIRAE